MIYKAFCVYDTQAEFYSLPYFSQTLALALRSFSDVCNAPDGNVSKHPEDFYLYEVGSFDDVTGLFTPLTAPHRVVSALELKKDS